MKSEWPQLLQALTQRHPLALRPGCTASDIQRAEANLGVTIPNALVAFLRASDGFTDLSAQYAWAWDIETVATENRRAWSDSTMPLDDDLIGFGGDGAGDWFCLSLTAPHDDAVLHWGWIDGSARRIADGLKSFWPAWLDGSLKV